jgi:hypothetical protein
VRGVPAEFDWMTPLAREIRRPISLALIQNLAYPDAWREALALVEEAHARRADRPADGGTRGRGAARVRHRHQPVVALPAAVDLLGLDRGRRSRASATRRCAPSSSRASATTAATSSAAWRSSSVFPLTGDGVRGYETAGPQYRRAGAREGRRALALMLDIIVAHEGRNFFLVPLFTQTSRLPARCSPIRSPPSASATPARTRHRPPTPATRPSRWRTGCASAA